MAAKNTALARPEGPKSAEEKELDFANYFATYAFLYHQKDMLTDRGRMDAYRNAVLQNRDCFKGKVVLDVGSGSGVLAIWAAMAGARKVYAVEATNMAQNARRLVAHNGWSDVITVLEGYMEQQELPEKVDIIISEWMGYFLLRESMLDSVLAARAKWLKPGGALYPSHAQIFLAPVRTGLHARRAEEYEAEMAQWAEFDHYMRAGNGIKIDCAPRDPNRAASHRCIAHMQRLARTGLDTLWRKEQQDYLMQTAMWCQLSAEEVIGVPCAVSDIDVGTATVEDISEIRSTFSSRVLSAGEFTGWGGWFDVQFRGSAEQPANEVELSTAPPSQTHWGQQVFLAAEVQMVEVDDMIDTRVLLTRQASNHRLLNLELSYSISRPGQGLLVPEVTVKYKID